jgi:hypothetical protein
MPVAIDLTPELEGRLRREAARLGVPPEAYVAQALEQHLGAGKPSSGNGSNGPAAAAASPARSEAHRLSAVEADLLQRINLGLPSDFWSEYRALLGRRDDGALTPDEQASLVAISDRMEEANARRMNALTTLAKFRGIGLGALIRDLGVTGSARG